MVFMFCHVKYKRVNNRFAIDHLKLLRTIVMFTALAFGPFTINCNFIGFLIFSNIVNCNYLVSRTTCSTIDWPMRHSHCHLYAMILHFHSIPYGGIDLHCRIMYYAGNTETYCAYIYIKRFWYLTYH